MTGDGHPEIAVGTYHQTPIYGSVYLFEPDGDVMEGWPKQVLAAISAPPTFADLTGDGVLEVICGENRQSICPNGFLYAWHRDGTDVEGFPFGPVHAVQAQVAVGDIDGDGSAELIWDDSLTTDGVGWLNGCHSDGSPIDGWPLKFFGTPVFNTVALADVDLDDDVEILCAVGNPGEEGGTIYLWDTPGDPASIQMPMYQYGPGRDGFLPTVPPVAVHPGESTRPFLSLRTHPNPFNPQVTIRYELDRAASVSLVVYDAAGRVVRNLLDRDPQRIGTGRVVWDARNDAGIPVSSGTYVVRAITPRGALSSRVVLLK